MKTQDLKNFLNLSGGRRNPLILDSVLSSRGYDSHKIKTLQIYLDLLKNSSILSPISYDFHINNLNYKQLMKKYGVNKGQVGNTISRDTKKIEKEIGVDIFEEVSSKNITMQTLNFYNKYLKELKNKYKKEKNSLTEQILIDLDEYFPNNVEDKPDMTKQDLLNILTRIQSLSKPYLQLLLDTAEPTHLGYIKYLIESENDKLSEEDLIIKKVIKDKLFLK